MPNREQQYAASVYGHVNEFKSHHPDENDNDRKRYGSMAHKLPILVRQSGLVQALMFVHSRRKDPYNELLAHLAETVGAANTDTLLESSRKAELSEYIYLTDQVLLALKWYKRFAQSVLKVDATEDVEDER